MTNENSRRSSPSPSTDPSAQMGNDKVGVKSVTQENSIILDDNDDERRSSSSESIEQFWTNFSSTNLPSRIKFSRRIAEKRKESGAFLQQLFRFCLLTPISLFCLIDYIVRVRVEFVFSLIDFFRSVFLHKRSKRTRKNGLDDHDEHEQIWADDQRRETSLLSRFN